MSRSHRRKRLSEIKLTPEGWVFLIVLGFITVGAVLRNVNLLIVMAGMMYAPLLLNWRFGVRRLKSLWAKRRIPNQIHSNQLTSIQWTCENRLPGVAAWNVTISDEIERAPDSEQTIKPSDADSETAQNGGNMITQLFAGISNRIWRKGKRAYSGAKLGFIRVNGGQSEVQAYRVYFGQRGKYLFGPASMSTTFPFGLIVSRTYFPEALAVFVAPQLGRLEPTWERRVQSTAVGSDTIKRRRALEEDEFYALRPWRSGDTKKNIHWRTTARFGRPIVKQYDQQNNRDFGLLIDLFADQQDGSSQERCELALSFAATVVSHIRHSVQGQIAVGVCGRETQVYRSRTPVGIYSDVMRSFSVAQSSATPEFEETLLQISSFVSRGTPIYVVSSRSRPEFLDPDNAPEASSEEAGDRESERMTRKLRQILPLIRWVSVDSDDFQNMFTIGNDPAREASLQKLSSKWAANARR